MNNDATTYEQMQDYINSAPMTYLPGLLVTCIQACIKKKVFTGVEGLVRFVTKQAMTYHE